MTQEYLSSKMYDIMNRIKNKRIEANLSYQELADKTGLSKSTLQRYETGYIKNMPIDKLELLANALNIEPAYLMGWDEETPPKRKGFKIPVLGHVAAGVPIEAIEDILDYEEITEELSRTGEFFGLQIKGDSMEPKFSSGDVVIVKVQSDADSGDVVIATVNGSDATCKRLQKYNEGIALIATNPLYEPMRFTDEEIKNTPVTIIGRVVELRAKF